MGPSIIGLEPHLSHTRLRSRLLTLPAFILDMSVTFGVDLEAELVSEQSKFRGAGIVGACLVLSSDVCQPLLIREYIIR
jgi:hypothetical protein